MDDRIIARRHNAYRLRAGTVRSVSPGRGPRMQAGIGTPAMEEIEMEWDGGETGVLTRRFPVEVLPGQRLYCLTPETGVSAHPDRPVFLFNAGNGQKHREVNAPMVRTRLQLATDRLPLLLVAVVAGAFLSIYAGRVDPPYPTISMALVAVVAAALLAWAVMTVSDRRGNRRRAERLEDELSAAQESVEAMNHDIAERHALARSRVQDDAVPREGADG